jgi:hypothetical protein
MRSRWPATFAFGTFSNSVNARLSKETVHLAASVEHTRLDGVRRDPEDARDQFGTLAGFAAFDIPASSAITRQRFGWRPTEPGLIADLDQGYYYIVRDQPVR